MRRKIGWVFLFFAAVHFLQISAWALNLQDLNEGRGWACFCIALMLGYAGAMMVTPE